MASTPTIFPACNRQDHSLIPDGEVCRACQSAPYRGIPDLPTPTPATSMATSTPLIVRLPQRPSVLGSDPPSFGLASQVLGEQPVQPRQRGYPRQRAAPPLRTHIPAPARIEAPSPRTLAPVETMYTYVIKIAEGEWPSDEAKEPIYISLDTQTTLTLSGNKSYAYGAFLGEFITATEAAGLNSPYRFDRGEWCVAINHMTKDKSLIILPKWSMATREVREVMQGWPNAKMGGNKKILPTAYPVTLCWKPHQDQAPSEISFDFSSVYEKYPDQLAPPPESPTPDPVPVPAPVPAAVEPATASHKRGASEVITRSEREAEHERERPARRAVGAQELAGLGIETAQEDGGGIQVGMGTQGRPRRIRVPSKAPPGDVRESWV